MKACVGPRTYYSIVARMGESAMQVEVKLHVVPNYCPACDFARAKEALPGG